MAWDQELVTQTVEVCCCTEWETDSIEVDATSGILSEKLQEEVTIWFR